jgi:hypothetical protein
MLLYEMHNSKHTAGRTKIRLPMLQKHGFVQLHYPDFVRRVVSFVKYNEKREF